MTKIRTFACAMLVVVVGCAVGQDDTLGSVDLELTGQGTDGSTYRLIAGAELNIIGPGFADLISLDGDSAVKRINLPPGAYEARLLINGISPGEWPLERTDGLGNSEIIYGTLITPMPATVTITQGVVTSFSLAFEVARARPVIFGRGHLDVSAAFEEVDGTAASVGVSGEYDDAPASVVVGEGLDPQLAAVLPAAGAGDVTTVLEVLVTGDWALTAQTRACAPAQVTAWYSNYPGLQALFEEQALGGSGQVGQVCVHDGISADDLEILVTYVGAARTELFQDHGPSQVRLTTDITVTSLPPLIFDGETIDLPALTEVDGVSAVLLVGIGDDAAVQALYDSAFIGGADQVRLFFRPRL
jgi:hypothetical protein